jgi:hypothetical protein
MIILQETASAQTFKIIPRTYVADTLLLKNEVTGDEISYAITITQTDHYAVITKILTLQEGNFYKLTVLNGGNVVYKDKVFCTNQSVSTFSVNNGEFNTYTSDNEYITYE